MTTTEGEQLAAWVKKSGKSLSLIFLTHGHADHFFGAGPILRGFPQARLVALPEVVEEARGQVGPQYRQVWSSFFPGQYDENPAVPEPLPSSDLQLDGHTVRAVAVGRADGPLATVLHIPELDAVICGDVAYNNIHMWLLGSTAQSRGAWLAAIDAVAALKPMTIVTGHKDPDAPDDDATRVLDQSRSYIEDFNRAVEKGGSAEEHHRLDGEPLPPLRQSLHPVAGGAGPHHRVSALREPSRRRRRGLCLRRQRAARKAPRGMDVVGENALSYPGVR